MELYAICDKNYAIYISSIFNFFNLLRNLFCYLKRVFILREIDTNEIETVF